MIPPSQDHGIPVPVGPRQLSVNQVTNLQQQGFSSGLIQAVAVTADRFPLRLWVIDNSSSMQERDAHVLKGHTLQGLEKFNCTRWEEAQEAVLYFSNMATLLYLPTRFIMLNDLGHVFGARAFSIGEQQQHQQQGGVATNNNSWAQDYQNAQNIIRRAYPSGATPLTRHIQQIRSMVASMAPYLRQRGQTVSVILATDGLPSDESGYEGTFILSQFIEALRSLEGLPVCIVVRLCTDDEKVFDFYNTIDSQINLPYDVLDDFYGEALEVYLQNPWLTYALPLHRFREFGLYVRVLDFLDEHALNISELRPFCCVLFQHGNMLPDPERDWLAFLRALAGLLAREKWQFNSITGTLCPWIDLRRLHLVYGHNLPFPPELHQPIPQRTVAPQQYGQHAAATQLPQSMKPQYQPPQKTASSSIPMNPHSPTQTRPPHQQPQPQPQPQQTPPQTYKPKLPPSPSEAESSHNLTHLKHNILSWAVTSHGFLKPIDQLLASIHTTFTLVAAHAYFQKWKPFSPDALQKRTKAVIQRAVRKVKFFLHPDKLPRDFTAEQHFLGKMLWDIMADALEEYEKLGESL